MDNIKTAIKANLDRIPKARDGKEVAEIIREHGRLRRQLLETTNEQGGSK